MSTSFERDAGFGIRDSGFGEAQAGFPIPDAELMLLRIPNPESRFPAPTGATP
ncbi:hypothetical protein [Luteimonas sp. R10]|uniref:hypothetical protein n=1 Tax=Luteimonas sp. R10 TaxID=3108176 RepID=UPI00308D12F7|nr:hypothetical protein U3649_13590 [Luteimonas sp. R10]